MRLFTHTIFSWGVGALLFYLVGKTVDPQLLGAFGNFWWPFMFAISWLGNHVIDTFGHGVTPEGFPKRLARTHSVFTAPLWGALAAVIVTWVLSKLWFVSLTPYYLGAIEIGVFIGYSHLFLDAFTQAGIYWTTNRIDIAHFSYNNVIANICAILVGFGALYLLSTI